MEIRDTIVDLIITAKPVEALDLIKSWCEQFGYEKAVSELLLPVLEQFTEDYVHLDASPTARAFVAAKVAEKTMNMVLEHTKSAALTEATKGPVVIGNIEDDFHSLGRKIIVAFLQASGWRVIDLGNDITATQFVDAALEHNAKIIAVSAMMYSTAVNIKKVRRELDNRGLSNKIILAVGGAVFNLRHELFAEVGGDATAESALDVPRLFDKLLEEIGKEDTDEQH